MITDTETDFLYLADTLPKKYPDFFQRFESLLMDCGITYSILPNTKDIWARDFMPIQITPTKFVQFDYNPNYLQSKRWLKTISNVDAICNTIGIKSTKSNIKVDGGNVVRSANKVILCDKVFKENPLIPEKKLILELYQAFQVDQIIFIPTHKQDKIGHSDGMVRFLDENTVLINDLSRENHDFQKNFRLAIHNARLDWIEIPYNPYGNNKYIQANGIYINYLQMKGKIILPIFGLDEDDKTAKQFESLFSGNTIATIDCNTIANDGGVLNCISWNIVSEY